MSLCRFGEKRIGARAGLRCTAASVLLAVFLFAASPGFSQQSKIGKLTGEAKRGKELFRRYCVGCHGPEGNGEGENAAYLDPKPRDFTMGLFKCRSTLSGSIPLDSDLFDTISRGVRGTFMPTWLSLVPQQRADLVAYVKTFSQRFQEEQPAEPIQIPGETPDSPESVARGRDLYKKLACFECHGPEGRGDGPSAQTLRDSKGNPAPPHDFQYSPTYKCGGTDRDIYRSFMTGLDSTPMPAYAFWLKPDQGWDLVHFLRSLRKYGRGPATPTDSAEMMRKEGENHDQTTRP
ncbi:MAG: c-type cytochrome [Candidatus Acidiferrales bacterium]